MDRRGFLGSMLAVSAAVGSLMACVAKKRIEAGVVAPPAG